MSYIAKKEYFALPDEENFLALGSASTHLRLKDGLEVELHKALLPLPKKLKDCLKEVKKEVK
ncbi:hypothetical protein [uncultured Mediterranean phage uvMED]|nr:hypothetical protein [uncultured Mediterranean phage uvMED]